MAISDKLKKIDEQEKLLKKRRDKIINREYNAHISKIGTIFNDIKDDYKKVANFLKDLATLSETRFSLTYQVRGIF